MKTTKQQNYQKSLLIKFQTMCGKMRLSDNEKYAIIESYGRISSKDMTIDELIDAIERLEHIQNPELAKMDEWRKRVIAAIGGWLKLLGREQNISIIKGIACRATGHENFNKIPLERLRNIYHAFVKKQNDFKSVELIAKEDIELLMILN